MKSSYVKFENVVLAPIMRPLPLALLRDNITVSDYQPYMRVVDFLLEEQHFGAWRRYMRSRSTKNT